MALYLLESQTLVLHVPRTAGTWLREVLHRSPLAVEELEPRHANPWHYGWQRSVDRLCCTWRPPDDLLKSWWRYCQVIGTNPWNEPPPFPFRRLPDPKYWSYLAWRRLVEETYPAFSRRLYDWYAGPPWDEWVTDWLQFEALTETTENWLVSLGVPRLDANEIVQLTPKNASDKSLRT